MKKSTDPDGKASGKSTAKDKSLRSRNKRKYKRKKSAKHHTKRAFEHSLREHGSHKAAPESDRFVHHRRRREEARPVGVGPSCPQIKHAQNVWMKTYQNIVKWQYQHQLNYWKQHALLLREENVRLRRRLTVHDSEDEADEALAYAEAATWELQNGQEAVVVEDDEALDEEFIAFMEVSARHRLERRRLKNESVH